MVRWKAAETDGIERARDLFEGRCRLLLLVHEPMSFLTRTQNSSAQGVSKRVSTVKRKDMGYGAVKSPPHTNHSSLSSILLQRTLNYMQTQNLKIFTIYNEHD